MSRRNQIKKNCNYYYWLRAHTVLFSVCVFAVHFGLTVCPIVDDIAICTLTCRLADRCRWLQLRQSTSEKLL